MLFPAVTELFGHLAQLPALDEAFEALRRGSPAEQLAGLTNPVKALVVALAAAELRRPIVVLVEDERRAASLLEPLQFFQRTLSGNSAGPVLLLPALDTLPGLGAGPHPEILEERASTLSRYVSGQSSIIVVPIEASLLGFAPTEFYESLSLSLERDAEISLKEVIAHLSETGYIRTELVDMEGQFSVRGGILDVFPAEAAKPVRIELLGDTVEALREFDPETQRSTGPVSRAILPPLTEFPLTPNQREDKDSKSSRFWPAQGAGEKPTTLFDLREDTLVVLDEPEQISQRAEKSRDRLLADSASLGRDGTGPLVLPEDGWKQALEHRQRFSLEELGLHLDGREPRMLVVQPTARYHGQIQPFLDEIRRRLSSGEEVLVSAASSGELERLADLCREYDVPYRLGELEQSATGARLVEEVTSGSAPAAVLLRAPLRGGLRYPRSGSGVLRYRRSLRDRSGARTATGTSENSGFLQRLQRTQSWGLRGAHGSRNRPIRGSADHRERWPPRRVHAFAICR